MAIPPPGAGRIISGERPEDIKWTNITGDSLYKDSLGQYIDYVINNRYFKPQHKYMLPLTTPNGFKGKSVAFVQLAAPTILWVADWTASRSFVPPEIPSPTFIINILKTSLSRTPTYLEDWVLLHEDLETVGALLEDADGHTPTYRISGTYYYGLTNPTAYLHRHAVIGLPPYIGQDGTIFRRIPDDLLTSDIIYSI